MARMLSFRLDKWLRVGAGLGLLLLLAAQEKVCPWAWRLPESGARDSAEAPVPSPASSDAEDADSPERKDKPRVLPYLLPDATAPRWPAAWNQVTVRQTIGARDGVVSCGKRDPARQDKPDHSAAGCDAASWRRFLRTQHGDWAIPLAARVVVGDPAIRTSISRTGPPRV